VHRRTARRGLVRLDLNLWILRRNVRPLKPAARENRAAESHRKGPASRWRLENVRFLLWRWNGSVGGNTHGFRLRRAIARVKEWIAAYPDSTTLRISLAYLYLNYSWLARGSDFANSVSESQWSLFKSRNAQAKAILFEAGTLKEKDPFWYEATQLVAHDEGWDQAYVHELFDQSVGF
jgi:hypothetical protein